MNNQEKLFKIGYWVGISLFAFLVLLSINQLISIRYTGRQYPPTMTVTVSGKGEAYSIPDIASFSFSVTETAKTVKEAQDKSNTKIDAALKAVKAGGVAEKDIKTTSYNISPHYEYTQGYCVNNICPPGKSVLTGYDVSQTVDVKVRDLSKAGDLFDSIGKTGVQNVNGLSFGIDDIDSVKAIARADAIKKAQEKAQKIANSLGVSLGKVTGFYDNGDDMAYRDAYAGISMAPEAVNIKAVTTQISTGEQKVTSSVSITYEIR